MSLSFPPEPTADPVIGSGEAADPVGPAQGPPSAPPAAAAIFGDRLELAEAFVAMLADTGVTHGLIGPRETPRLWERHVLNCGVLARAFPTSGAEVVDVGSGAGLPGIAVAIARPDLQLHLIEPMLRRTQWLTDTLDGLGLTNVSVHRARAQELHGRLRVPYVTARAVARLDKLVGWCAPLVAPGGRLVAMKGSAAPEEIREATAALRRGKFEGAHMATYGADVLAEPTTTIECVKRVK